MLSFFVLNQNNTDRKLFKTFTFSRTRISASHCNSGKLQGKRICLLMHGNTLF